MLSKVNTSMFNIERTESLVDLFHVCFDRVHLVYRLVVILFSR